MMVALHAHIDEQDMPDERKEVAKSVYAFMSEDYLRTMYQLLLKAKFRDALCAFVRDFVLEA